MDVPIPSHATKKELFYLHNNLVCLAKALEKKYTTIDLRNETSVTGKIEEVDGYMNLVIKDAALYDTDGNYRYFPLMHIQARNIRDIIIPNNIPIVKTIKNQVLKEPKVLPKKKPTFKESRAKKQHRETLELIKEMKEKKSLAKKVES